LAPFRVRLFYAFSDLALVLGHSLRTTQAEA